MFRILPFVLVLAIFGDSAVASDKFRVEGDTIYFDTENTLDPNAELEAEDATELRVLLRNAPNVSRIVLNSGGGGYFAGFDMGEVIIDFELDTHVEEECSSSCVNAFLGGARRTLARGARIGFHHKTWSAESIQSFYEDDREYYDWDTPFDQSSWIYESTQQEMYDELSYVIGRGVDPLFAVETLRNRMDGLWYPRRSELKKSGVLTE